MYVYTYADTRFYRGNAAEFVGGELLVRIFSPFLYYAEEVKANNFFIFINI